MLAPGAAASREVRARDAVVEAAYGDRLVLRTAEEGENGGVGRPGPPFQHEHADFEGVPAAEPLAHAVHRLGDGACVSEFVARLEPRERSGRRGRCGQGYQQE